MDVIQAQFEDLEAVASRFGQQSTAGDELLNRVRSGVKALEGGGWEGKGAEAFFGEMYGTVVPSLERLSQALDEARTMTLDVRHLLHQAEEEAARLFSGEAAAGASSPSGGSGATGEDGGADGAYADVRSPGTKKVGDLLLTGMQRETNGELFVTDPADGRAIHPSDADQGNIGDCFFAASLAAVAQQNPELIRRAIRQNADGTFTVTFYEERGGFLGIGTHVEPVEITVTPDFPTGQLNVQGTMQNATPHIEVNDRDANGKPEMWAMIMERAYAQWKGDGNALAGYGQLHQGGRPENVLFALTGQESSTDDADEHSISELARMNRDGYAITFSTIGDGGKKALYNNGTLVSGHEYYVTGVDERAGTVTLRNPWGWGRGEVTIPYNQLDANFDAVTVNPLTSR
jgi:WXG100 family type VII secretion target